MSDQQTPETTSDEDFDEMTVNIVMHNPDGEGNSVLMSPLLGLDPFILIQPGDGGPEVTAAMMNADDVAGGLALVLLALLQSEEMTDEGRGAVAGVLEDVL